MKFIGLRVFVIDNGATLHRHFAERDCTINFR